MPVSAAACSRGACLLTVRRKEYIITMAFLDSPLSRRRFLRSSAVAVAGGICTGTAPGFLFGEVPVAATGTLKEFGYADVVLLPGAEDAQLEQTHAILMGLTQDQLLKPFRVRAGVPAPGPDMGGWYDAYAFAPGHSFGQWLSALSRYYAITGDEATRHKVVSMVRGYAAVPDATGSFFENNRFPAYTLDKLNCGMIDAHEFANDPEALAVMRRMTAAARPHLPEKALSRVEQEARPHKDITYTYDESYTLPENYFLAWQRSGDREYRELGIRYLHNDGFFTPLSQGQNVLPGLHAYSHLNCLNSAMQAYLVLNDPKYLHAAVNGFRFIQEQSFATGGWGPNERFVTPGQGALAKSLTTTHSSFETPCGSYGHLKLTRSLLRVTKDPRYGDSMEAILYNTVLGAKPLQADGEAFYYSDYNFAGKKGFARDKWPCCSGTLPQVSADYRISTYLHDNDSLFVNLYLPSSLRWNLGSGVVTVSQSGSYPLDGTVKLTVTSTARRNFAINLRIPAWAGDDARITINGEPYPGAIHGGTFVPLRRAWGSGDRVELSLPMRFRLQQVDAETPGTVALMRGPLVLFRTGQSSEPLQERDLLQARQLSTGEWLVPSTAGDQRFKPFTAIDEETYGTYTNLV